MFLFVVLDTKGSGRVLGVFSDRARAEEIRDQHPHYYHLHPAGLMGEVPLQGAVPDEDAPSRVQVVVDTMGQYRLVGVLAERRAARRLTRKSPGYYRVVECPLDRINPEVLDWVDTPAQRALLEAIIAREPGGAGWPTARPVRHRVARAETEQSSPVQGRARLMDTFVGTIEHTLEEIVSVDRTPTPDGVEQSGRLRRRLLEEVEALHVLSGLVEDDRPESGTFWVTDGKQFLLAVHEIRRITDQVQRLLLEMERLSTTTRQTPDVYRLRGEVEALIAEMLLLRPSLE